MKATAMTDAEPRVRPFTAAASPSVAIVPTSTVPAVDSAKYTPSAIQRRHLKGKGTSLDAVWCVFGVRVLP